MPVFISQRYALYIQFVTRLTHLLGERLFRLTFRSRSINVIFSAVYQFLHFNSISCRRKNYRRQGDSYVLYQLLNDLKTATDDEKILETGYILQKIMQVIL